MWTIATVKAELPSVRVRIAKGKIVDGRLSGRLNEFATVCCGWSTAGRDWVDFQFSWATIARALNENRPLTV